MYLTLNGSDNCTATAPRPCNGLPMLRRGLEVVRLIIIISQPTKPTQPTIPPGSVK